jgi:teichoic acid transport system permease protein
MKEIFQVFKDQILNLGTIKRIANYESKSQNSNKYLGELWDVIDPFFQVATYFIIFGLGMKRVSPAPYEKVPYLAWMMIGMTVWYFVNQAYLYTLKSISSQSKLITKMRFPVSILPSVRIAQKFSSLYTLGAVTIITLIVFKVHPSISWLQIIYYLLAALILVYVLGLASAVMVVIVPDFDNLARTFMRIIFWVSGVLWQVDDKLPGFADGALSIIQKINPFYYLVNGIRDAMLGGSWFWENWQTTGIFWLEIVLITMVAVNIYTKFRDQLVDFL